MTITDPMSILSQCIGKSIAHITTYQDGNVVDFTFTDGSCLVVGALAVTAIEGPLDEHGAPDMERCHPTMQYLSMEFVLGDEYAQYPLEGRESLKVLRT